MHLSPPWAVHVAKQAAGSRTDDLPLSLTKRELSLRPYSITAAPLLRACKIFREIFVICVICG
jgi:hypothetical protein